MATTLYDCKKNSLFKKYYLPSFNCVKVFCLELERNEGNKKESNVKIGIQEFRETTEWISFHTFK